MRQQELNTAGHVVFAFRKKKAIHVCAQLTLLSIVRDPSLGNDATHRRQVFLHQLA